MRTAASVVAFRHQTTYTSREKGLSDSRKEEINCMHAALFYEGKDMQTKTRLEEGKFSSVDRWGWKHGNLSSKRRFIYGSSGYRRFKGMQASMQGQYTS